MGHLQLPGRAPGGLRQDRGGASSASFALPLWPITRPDAIIVRSAESGGCQ